MTVSGTSFDIACRHADGHRRGHPHQAQSRQAGHHGNGSVPHIATSPLTPDLTPQPHASGEKEVASARRLRFLLALPPVPHHPSSIRHLPVCLFLGLCLLLCHLAALALPVLGAHSWFPPRPSTRYRLLSPFEHEPEVHRQWPLSTRAPNPHCGGLCH